MKDLRVRGQHKIEMQTKNGVLDEDNVSFIKRTVLFNALRQHKDLVKYKMDYPKDEISNVTFDTDFVIISIERYKDFLIETKEGINRTFK